jgi:hypothetical protein
MSGAENFALLGCYAAISDSYRRFGTTYRSNLQGSRIQTNKANYQYSLRNNQRLVIVIDVSGQPIGPIFRGQEFKPIKLITSIRGVTTQKSAVLIYFAAEA